MIILVSIYKCGDEELVEKTTATQLGKCHSAGHKPSLQLGVRGDSRGRGKEVLCQSSGWGWATPDPRGAGCTKWALDVRLTVVDSSQPALTGGSSASGPLSQGN